MAHSHTGAVSTWQVRSDGDPMVAALRLTNGTLHFGRTRRDQLQQAISANLITISANYKRDVTLWAHTPRPAPAGDLGELNQVLPGTDFAGCRARGGAREGRCILIKIEVGRRARHTWVMVSARACVASAGEGRAPDGRRTRRGALERSEYAPQRAPSRELPSVVTKAQTYSRR